MRISKCIYPLDKQVYFGLINVIDEVYSELRLVEKISKSRGTQVRREVPDVVKEPVHHLRGDQALELRQIRELLTEMDSRLRRFGY